MNQLVDEVTRFVKTGPLLVPSDSPTFVNKICDLTEAKRLAWEQPYGVSGYLWTDIREREMSLVRQRSRSLEGDEERQQIISEHIKTFTLVLRRRLGATHIELLDDVVGDLVNCAFNRASCGREDNFYERLFMVYKSGGWPCGWDGDYPSGRLIGYFPKG